MRHAGRKETLWLAALTGALVSSCGGSPMIVEPLPPPMPPVAAPAAPTVADAKTFVDRVNVDLKRLWSHGQRVQWVQDTYITVDTEQLSATAQEQTMAYEAQAIKEAQRFAGMDLPAETARMLYLLRYASGLPSPENAVERQELADIMTKMTSLYGKGRYCSPKLIGYPRPKGESAADAAENPKTAKQQKTAGKGSKDAKVAAGETTPPDDGCRNLDQLSEIIGAEKEWDILQEAWQGWHQISPPMRPLYERFVTLGNSGAKNLGFQNMAEIWQGRYDMPPAEFRAEMDRLWLQVKPLYDELHCFTRTRLQERYGKDRIPDGGGIPAHVVGNMWAQEWSNLASLVEPFPGKSQPDLTQALVAANFDAKRLVQTAEGLFDSLGMGRLPETFWDRSMFLRPRDREVVCHASAWDVDMSGDLRIKMCIKIDEEDFVTVHHELGHDYYFKAYDTLPALFQQGANDGFHEGIGDTLALSVTPGYLKQIGLTKEALSSKEADLNLLMQRALDGIAFLPFGKLIDEWRWDVFEGRIAPAEWNGHWWKLRQKYQGVVPPVARTEADFDPGAKYHVPANVPYTRYFIARVLQYQFLRALCKEAGHQGPLYQCSLYGSKAAGTKLNAMMALGASKPWPDALEAIGAGRQMDASAIIDYYQPLVAWLKEQNQGHQCGWTE